MKSEDENFESSLKALDRISNRTYDKLYAFIVRKNKTDWEEILKNEVWYLVYFLDKCVYFTYSSLMISWYQMYCVAMPISLLGCGNALFSHSRPCIENADCLDSGICTSQSKLYKALLVIV